MRKLDNWKEFGLMFGVQFFQYCIICISFIALAKGRYVWTFVSDAACGLNSYFIIRRISNSDAKSHLGVIGYTLGGSSGSMLAIWLTKHLMGQ